ncbi:MAG: hypothetical protein LBH75_03075 [Treponema sp.]|jgi:hypothetical protein|nr:hypothetical protein [Treponema sp.]
MKADIETGKNILMEALKNPPVSDRDTIFHYSRTQRLKRASRDVKDLNNGVVRKPSVFGIFRSSKSHGVLFMSIIILCAFITIIAKVSDNSYKLDGNKLTVSAMRYEGATFLVFKKTFAEGAYTGPVDIAVSPSVTDDSPSVEPAVFTWRVYFTPDNEDFPFSIPLEAQYLTALLRTETKSVGMKIKAE